MTLRCIQHFSSHMTFVQYNKTCSYVLNASRFQIHSLRFIVIAEIIMIKEHGRERRKKLQNAIHQKKKVHQKIP